MLNNRQALNATGVPGDSSLLADVLGRFAPRNTARDRTGMLSTQAAAAAPPIRRGLLERLDQWHWSLRQRDIEAYLGKATDLCNLEARLRAVEHAANGRLMPRTTSA